MKIWKFIKNLLFGPSSIEKANPPYKKGSFGPKDRVIVNAVVNFPDNTKRRISGKSIVISELTFNGYYKIRHKKDDYYVKGRCLRHQNKIVRKGQK